MSKTYNNKNAKDNKKPQQYQKKGYQKKQIDPRIERAKTRSALSKARKDSFDRGANIFSIIMLALLVIAMIGILNGNEQIPTFRSFLELLRDVPVFRLDVLNIDLLSTDTSGCPTFLLDIANTFIGIVNALTFIGTAILNSLIIMVYFLRWIFF